ncbi:hypothetical protein Tsubulata_043892 [Turnera subulata]|uniref:Uncharacterized protein n=1 Tax=Turnera subulata TaxID=218843 RepID=A0A9Q0FUI8_9ROSI|nr:hypothetical protein Tsubulata_043892 [Turnera subulata]
MNSFSFDPRVRGGPASHEFSESGEEFARVELTESYSVHIPLTPNNQPMEIPVENDNATPKAYTRSDSMFIGGHNSPTRAHSTDKVVHSHPSRSHGLSCFIPGCKGRVLRDERGEGLLICGCGYLVCEDCYNIVVGDRDGVCPGCKERYKVPVVLDRTISLRLDYKDLNGQEDPEVQVSEFLFGSSKDYGSGTAVEGDMGGNGDDYGHVMKVNKRWKPLTREVNVSAAVIIPYR